ncbi:hypothetical protein N9K89_04545 [Schleiferiaceae bacterium]|nr:hypothetical protein [Schleiferiaceae bacterium]
MEDNPYSLNDALERNNDLEGLLSVLNSIRNLVGQKPKFTINYITANPDFKRIEESDFTSYYYITSDEQRKRYPQTDRLKLLYNDGIKDGIIKPQLHGREHLNVNRWLIGLKHSHPHLLAAFEQEMFSLVWQSPAIYRNEYMDALDYDTVSDRSNKCDIISDGAELFKSEWDFYSKSFIAPCYIWDDEIEEALSRKGVKYFQSLKIQYHPKLKNGFTYKRKFHFTGQKNNKGQRYLVRNAFYEPTSYPQSNQVELALNQIDFAFRHNTPAILSTHRVNFIGRLSESNRTRGLKGFTELLKQVVRRWPEVEFMFSDELGDLIENKN